MDSTKSPLNGSPDLEYRPYSSEEYDLADIIDLVDQELSEPYNIYTFRYFLQEWPHLAWLVFPNQTEGEDCVRPRAIATIVCKQDYHKGRVNRGYIAMLSVDKAWRRKGIARKLIDLAMNSMVERGADEIVLETEFDNGASLSLYGSMGFIKDRRLYRFYLNGKDAFRLVYPVPKPEIVYGVPPSNPSSLRHLAPLSTCPALPTHQSEPTSSPHYAQSNSNTEQNTQNGSSNVNGEGFETLVEEAEDDESQVDAARERVELGLVL